MPDVTGTPVAVEVTPTPAILKAITRNPLKPVDALCELIDNAIDSFSAAIDEGLEITNPVIEIDLPSRQAVRMGEWVLSVRDNGPGLTREGALAAVTAGYSGNNPFDRLGLFGLGFNTATGKIGALTELRTRRHDSDDWTLVEVDLERMVSENNYNVDVSSYRAEDTSSRCGTNVQVTRPWSSGDPNSDFIDKITSSHAASLRKQIGRRYATLIRERGLRITINGSAVEPFYHCIWDKSRAIWMKTKKVPAVYLFDHVVGSGNYCTACHTRIFESECRNCTSGSLITREQRVRGWVGIQRYDDANEFGIDFIRNGRAILVAEKDAVFTWVTDDGEKIKDYPIDSPYGRIVGEVHIDHVPTDYLKQDFQRTSEEWQDVMSLIRGNSTLQPKRRVELDEPENNSPLYKLYQAYRRVREPGKKSLYPGYWPKGASKPSRLDRAQERELIKKFKERVPGFIDDAEWWRLVEQAETSPVHAAFKECPECQEQTFDDAESCPGCGYVFVGKECPNCGQRILAAEQSCPFCEAPQPKPSEPWLCSFCKKRNTPDADNCQSCKRARHEINPLTRDQLLDNSSMDENLSIADFAITLPGAGASAPISVNVHVMQPGSHLQQDAVSLPLVRFIDGTAINFFIDLSHDAFVLYGDRPEDYISMELARWVIAANEAQRTPAFEYQWTLGNIYWRIHHKYWSDRLQIAPAVVKDRIERFFTDVRERLPELLESMGQEIYDELDDLKKAEILKRAVQEGGNVSHMDELVSSGSLFAFFPSDLIISLVRRYPSHFFDGYYWDADHERIDLSGEPKVEVQKVVLRRYQLLLEDALNYFVTEQPDSGYTARANHTIELLERDRVRD